MVNRRLSSRFREKFLVTQGRHYIGNCNIFTAVYVIVLFFVVTVITTYWVIVNIPYDIYIDRSILFPFCDIYVSLSIYNRFEHICSSFLGSLSH